MYIHIYIYYIFKYYALNHNKLQLWYKIIKYEYIYLTFIISQHDQSKSLIYYQCKHNIQFNFLYN